MLAGGKIGEKDMALLHVTDDVDDAVEGGARGLPGVGGRALSAPIGSACTARPSTASRRSYVELAAAVGRGIAARGWELVSGGGSSSMMGAVARRGPRRAGRARSG